MSVRVARTASSHPLASRPLLRVRTDRKCGKGLIIDRPRDLGRLVGHRVRVKLRVVKGIWHADVVFDAWHRPAALVSEERRWRKRSLRYTKVRYGTARMSFPVTARIVGEGCRIEQDEIGFGAVSRVPDRTLNLVCRTPTEQFEVNFTWLDCQALRECQVGGIAPKPRFPLVGQAITSVTDRSARRLVRRLTH
jgi:hypothetical protein